VKVEGYLYDRPAGRRVRVRPGRAGVRAAGAVVDTPNMPPPSHLSAVLEGTGEGQPVHYGSIWFTAEDYDYQERGMRIYVGRPLEQESYGRHPRLGDSGEPPARADYR
jgi:hypothetical protein